jgi:hypothetical protein
VVGSCDLYDVTYGPGAVQTGDCRQKLRELFPTPTNCCSPAVDVDTAVCMGRFEPAGPGPFPRPSYVCVPILYRFRYEGSEVIQLPEEFPNLENFQNLGDILTAATPCAENG